VEGEGVDDDPGSLTPAPLTVTSAAVGGAKEIVKVGAPFPGEPGTSTMPAVASLAGKLIVIVLSPESNTPIAGFEIVRYAGRADQGCGPPVGQSPVDGYPVTEGALILVRAET
jgi:hypothetical protein